MSEYDEKVFELGHLARVLIDMHIENPSQTTYKHVIDKLLDEYERLEFEPIVMDM